MNDDFKVGNILSKLRKEKGWTQKELADKLHISDKAVSKWETNEGEPNKGSLKDIAELFGISLEYLMTGKEQEEKIVTISKLELCAKKDDIEMYKDFLRTKMVYYNFEFRDENNKSIFDYIFEYESKKLFIFIFSNHDQDALTYILQEHYNDSEFWENVYYMKLICGDYNNIIRDLIRLEYKNTTLDNRIYNDKGIYYNGNSAIVVPRKILSDRIIQLIVNGPVDKLIYDAITSNHSEHGFYSPAFIFPYVLEMILKQKDWKKSKELLNKAIVINKENFEKEIYEHYGYKGFVQIPNSTFDFLFDEEKYELIELANQVNKIVNDYHNRNSEQYKYINYVATNYDIEKNKINKNKKLSNLEKQKLLCIHDGIVNIDELIAINDFKFYEETIKKYPVCNYEVIFEQLHNKEYEKVLAFINELPYNTYNYRERNKTIYKDNESIRVKLEGILEMCFGFNINYDVEENAKYLLKFIPKMHKTDYYEQKFHIKYKQLLESKDYLFLKDVLDKDLRFVEKACKTATQNELDDALEKITPNNFEGINILLNHGAMLRKTWLEEDDDDTKTIIGHDKIGTEILKKKIKEIL